jgi:hypothetical protein
MKAKKVYEFQQGQDPYKTMSLGAYSAYRDGDKMECLYNLTLKNNKFSWYWTKISDKDAITTIPVIYKGTIAPLEKFDATNIDWVFDGRGLSEEDLNTFFRRI